MKTKILIITNVILFIIIIFMGTYIYRGGKEENDRTVKTDKYDTCLVNPIDPLFARALTDAHIMAEYRQIQELYYDTWKTQYDTLMKKIRKKCKYNGDIKDYSLFIKEMDEGFEYLQPLLIDEMLDNYGMPESPEKHSMGNGTYHTLLMQKGTMYRNACMFFISLDHKSDYQFPVNKVEKALSGIKS